MAHELGDAPIEPKHHDLMNALAKGLDGALNPGLHGKDKKVGFVLLMFNFNDDSGRCNYISNADRKDVVVMLKHQIKRFEGQPDITGTA